MFTKKSKQKTILLLFIEKYYDKVRIAANSEIFLNNAHFQIYLTHRPAPSSPERASGPVFSAALPVRRPSALGPSSPC